MHDHFSFCTEKINCRDKIAIRRNEKSYIICIFPGKFNHFCRYPRINTFLSKAKHSVTTNRTDIAFFMT